MESKGVLKHTIVHGVFVGLARSGKDSLMKRLLGKKVPRVSPSTGVAENVIQVKVMKQSTTIAASIDESCWMEMDDDDEAIKTMLISTHCERISQQQMKKGILVRALVTVPANSVHDEVSGKVISEIDTTISNTSYDTSTDPVKDYHNMKPSHLPNTSNSNPPLQDIMPKVIVSDLLRNALKGALQRKGSESLDLQLYFQKTWSLYLTNTGGQMEFQEVLPLLVSGPSIFLFIFRLDRNLNEYYSIEYELATGGKSCPYTATSTTIEGILQTLASISSMGTFIFEGLKKRQVALRPKVFFIGTHRDQLASDPILAASQIKSIDKQLQEVINLTSHGKELVEYATPSQLIFTVNNFSESDSNFQNIRLAIEQVIMRGIFQMTSPVHWLIFSLALRKLNSRVISYDLCYKIAKQCGIDSREELNESLYFIHSKMGLIRYFPYNEELKNIVIIDPQFLFDKVTELIVDTFTFEKVGKLRMDEFKHKGIFSMDELEMIHTESESEITSSQLGELLVHLRIAAPIQIDGEEKLFLPCVLSHAKISTRNIPVVSTQVPSILATFECDYIPKGVPGALIAFLVSTTDWTLLTDEIFKDQISFVVGAYDTVVIKIFPTHFEINCIRDTQFTRDNQLKSPIEETCDKVFRAINVGIPQILKDLSYIKRQYNLTFPCPAPDCKCKHKTQVLMDKSGCSGTLFCQITKKRFKLPLNSYYWGYGKKPCRQQLGTENGASQPSIADQHAQITNMQLHQTASNVQHTLSTEVQGAHGVALPPEVSTSTQTATRQTVSLKEEHHLHIFKQLRKHSSDWANIGLYLGFLPSEIRNIQASPLLLFNGSDGWLSTLIEKWLQWAPGDSRGSKNFATLENLKSALLKAGFGATAHNLHI